MHFLTILGRFLRFSSPARIGNGETMKLTRTTSQVLKFFKPATLIALSLVWTSNASAVAARLCKIQLGGLLVVDTSVEYDAEAWALVFEASLKSERLASQLIFPKYTDHRALNLRIQEVRNYYRSFVASRLGEGTLKKLPPTVEAAINSFLRTEGTMDQRQIRYGHVAQFLDYALDDSNTVADRHHPVRTTVLANTVLSRMEEIVGREGSYVERGALESLLELLSSGLSPAELFRWAKFEFLHPPYNSSPLPEILSSKAPSEEFEKGMIQLLRETKRIEKNLIPAILRNPNISAELRAIASAQIVMALDDLKWNPNGAAVRARDQFELVVEIYFGANRLLNQPMAQDRALQHIRGSFGRAARAAQQVDPNAPLSMVTMGTDNMVTLLMTILEFDRWGDINQTQPLIKSIRHRQIPASLNQAMQELIQEITRLNQTSPLFERSLLGLYQAYTQALGRGEIQLTED